MCGAAECPELEGSEAFIFMACKAEWALSGALCESTPLTWVGAVAITLQFAGPGNRGHFRRPWRPQWRLRTSLGGLACCPHPMPLFPPGSFPDSRLLLRTVPRLGAPSPLLSLTPLPCLSLPNMWQPGGKSQRWAPCPQPSSPLAAGREGQGLVHLCKHWFQPPSRHRSVCE